MFQKQTLFIVGAGASFEFGLPTGNTLAATMQKKMDIRFELETNKSDKVTMSFLQISSSVGKTSCNNCKTGYYRPIILIVSVSSVLSAWEVWARRN